MGKILSSSLLALAAAGLVALWWWPATPAGRVAGSASWRTRTVYVSPKGDDRAAGSWRSPWRTIQHALEQARPGTTIKILAGTYQEKLHSSVSGAAGQPITLQAVGNVKLAGADGEGRILELKHDYYRLSGFEFTGGDIQLYLQETDHALVDHNYFHHAAGECVRFKYQSADNVFEYNRVEYCGREDFAEGGGGKNGEGVYIGTAPEQLSKNPTAEADHSNNNIIRHNRFTTHGNECVDIKEGSEKNIVEFNNCTAQLDLQSGAFDSRGNRNIFRYNRIYGNQGAGLRFGGDTAEQGLYNEAYGNVIMNNEREAFKIMRWPQGSMCGNILTDNKRGVSNRADVQNAGCGWPLLRPGV